MSCSRLTYRMATPLTLALVAGTSHAQPVVPSAGDTIVVLPDPTSWIMRSNGNAITIPTGADGVTIDNRLGGMIRSDDAAAIETSAQNTSVLNAGTIFGGFYGINFVNGLGAGSISNAASGVIASDSRAINIGGAVSIVNSGSILGTGDQRNGTIYSDSAAQGFGIENLFGGEIDAGAGNLGAGFSAELASGGTDFNIVNDGAIVGRGNAGAGLATAGDGIRLERSRVGGALDGSTTGLFTGSITNTGTISSEGTNGTVAGFRAVNGVSFQGTLENSGTITGTQNGVYFGNAVGAGGADHTGGVVNNSGLISSGSRAFNLDGLGLTVNNDGQILGTGNQRNGTFYADGTADSYTVNNNTSGLIDAGAGNQGSGFGAEIGGAADGANTFALTNTGTIRGRGNASASSSLAGDGVRVGNVGNIGTAELTLNNSGTISSEGANGTVAGIRFVNGISFDGELNNTGTITGVQNGVYFGNPVDGQGADHSSGVVNNSGLISSDSRAFNVDGDGLTVNNRGDILATGRQRNGTLYVDGTADNFSIKNFASGVIDASGGAGSGVSIQVGSSDSDIQSASVTNAGYIAGAGEQFVDAGIRLFTSDPGATFAGDIINLAGGTITAESAPAVLVQDGVNFRGTLINGGLIDGAVSLSTGDAELLDTSVISLSIFGTESAGDETVSIGGALFADGTLDLVFEDLGALSVGDSFDVLDFQTLSGGFDAVLSGPVALDTSDLLLNGSVTVTAVPTPASVALLAVSGTVAARRRRG
ncbi:MAG: calcium-binding protein [Planctomycetota bacterium]